MGEVYRATDSNLKRSVAIKVLPASVAGDPERLSRFQREAEVLAALNHANIAAIYGLERTPTSTALVMELVEGEDLSERIARGAIPLAEALSIAKQIAEALEAAHEQGIIHRDLKPANIKLRADSTVKVLDFGLAKAIESGSGLGDRGPGIGNPTLSPTITSPALMTGVGTLLGTAAYMAPEQARGKAVDRRADIWAFGAVLFEMLTGTRAFPGEDITETVAAVVKMEPTWDALAADLPARVRQVLRVCLKKDPKQRVQAIGDVRLALEGAFETVAPAAHATPVVVSRTRERIAWIAFAIASMTAIALAAWMYLGRMPADTSQTRFFISLPDKWRMADRPSEDAASPLPLAVSPDGRRIAFLAAGADGKTMLWVRSLDALTAQQLAGTEGAASPFWSPDSRALGFFAGGKLKKIDASGGPAVTLCDAPNNRGGTWGRDNIIVFNPTNGALQKVGAGGGVPTAASELGAGESGHRRPFFLPDGRHFLFSVGTTINNVAIYVGSLDSMDRQRLVKADANNAAYAQGHLLYVLEATLMAQPFDPATRTTTGEPVPIAEQLQASGTIPPNRFFSVSESGILIYQTGTTEVTNDRQLTWFDRTGKVVGLVDKPGQFNTVAISPDGTRVAVSRNDVEAGGARGEVGNIDLWVHEFARGNSTRFTFDAARDWMATWSSDGSRLIWGSTRDSNLDNLYQKVANGAGTDEGLLKSNDLKFPYSSSPDGRFLLYGLRTGSPLRTELWVLPLTGNTRTPTRYLQQAGFNLHQARFSPDGRFVAYTSDASGRNEVYVQPFPVAEGGKWLVSQGGGSQPRWRSDGRELFYISGDSKLMAVSVETTATTTPTLVASVPKALFPAPIWGGGNVTNTTRYDVTADGKKFLINVLPVATTTTTTAAPPAPITVVLNWAAGIKK
jgi:Tol biopolymer transport system component